MAQEAKPNLSGWLLKLGEKGITKRWKARWFELANKTELHYFVSNDMTNANNTSKGFIDLHKAVSVEIEEKEKKAADCKFIFQIHLPERDYVLAASSEDDRQFWNSRISDILVKQGKPKKKPVDKPLSPTNAISHIEKLKTEISQLKTQMENDKKSHQSQIEGLKKEFEEWKTTKEKEMSELKAMVFKQNFQKIFTSPKLISEREPVAEECIIVQAVQPTEEFTTTGEAVE